MGYKQPETTREWLDHYEKLKQKNYYMFQETGEPKYDNAYIKYDTICEAFRAKLSDEDDRDSTIRKRLRNRDGAKANLIKDEYSLEEVCKLLDDAVWW